MTVTGKTLETNKTIASQVVALRKEGRTVQQIANVLHHDRRIIDAVIKSCVASGMLDKAQEDLIKLRGRNKRKTQPLRAVSPSLGDSDWR